MNETNRDMRILEHIAEYCEQIEEAVARFGDDESIFLNDRLYRNAVSLCILQIGGILQIGELVTILSDEFKESHLTIPWRNIKIMRNIVAHKYGTIDHSITWDVVKNDIPILKEFCQSNTNSVILNSFQPFKPLVTYLKS